jgi:hypothetical protein
MRSSLLITMLACLSSVALSQAPSDRVELSTCTLTLDHSPVILGLKLGSSPSESSFAIGRAVISRDIRSKIRVSRTVAGGAPVVTEQATRHSIGETEFSYYPSSDTNVGSIYLRFWKNRLFTVLLDFDQRDFGGEPGSESIAVAKRLGVPPAGWQENRLECDGFYVNLVRREKSIQVELTDSLIKEEIKKLAEETIALEARWLPVPVSNTVEPRPTLKRRRPQ